MIKKTILLNTPIEESKKIIESIIPILNCKIKDVVIEDPSIITIYWETEEKAKIICKSELYKQRNKTKIINELKGNSNKAENLFLEFCNAISDNSNAILDVINKKNNPHNPQNANLNDEDIWTIVKKPLIGVGIVFLIFYYYKNMNDSSSSTNISSSNMFLTQSGYKASYSEESLEKLVKYSVHNDLNGINHLFLNNEIFDLPSGKEVYVLKTKFGRVKIRIKDENREVWTFTEAIDN